MNAERARALSNAICLITAAVVLFGIVQIIATGIWSRFSFTSAPLALTMPPLALVCLELNRRGRTGAAAWLFIIGYIVLTCLRAPFSSGVRAPSVGLFPIMTMFAGIILGRRAGIAVALVCLTAGAGLLILEYAGALQLGVIAYPPFVYWAALCLNTVVALLLIRLALDRTLKALADARSELAFRQEAEKALSESEARYRLLADNVADIIVRYDMDGIIEYASPSIRQLGYDPKAIVGRHVMDFVAGSADSWNSALDAVREGRLLPAELADVRPVRRADGSEVWIQGSPAPIYGEDGKVVGIVTVLRDVSERRAMEDELRRLNWALGAYARSAPALRRQRAFDDLAADVCNAIVVNDVYVLAWVGLADHTPGKPVRPVAASGQAIAYMENLKVSWSDQAPEGLGPTGIAIRSGRPHIMRDSASDPTYAHWRERGMRLGIRSSVTVPIMVGASVVGAVLVYASQTNAFGEDELGVFAQLADELGFALSLEEDRKALEASEQARRQAEQLAVEAQAELARVARVSSLGELAASIAHEINQPLTGVVTNSDASLRWLAADPPNLDQARKALARAVRDANRSSEVIRRTRAFLAKDEPRFDAFDLNEAVEDLLLFTQGEQARADITIRSRIPHTLPQVHGDRTQIQQVLLNLVLNAIDAIKVVSGREGVLQISVEQAEPGFVSVAVEDNGVGLDPAVSDRLFDHLFTTKVGGTGLGLPISRSIIEAHGGRLVAMPRSPHGAVFSFTLRTGN